MDLEKVKNENVILFKEDGSNFHEQVECLEKLLINSGSPDVIVGNSEELPLTHTFTDGIYAREHRHEFQPFNYWLTSSIVFIKV
jgi:hypothetical protein